MDQKDYDRSQRCNVDTRARTAVVGVDTSHSSLGVEHSLSKRKVVGSNPACGYYSLFYFFSISLIRYLGATLLEANKKTLPRWTASIRMSLRMVL